MVARAIGIDLGTTFSAAAYVDDRGVPRVIPNADGKQTTPSVVLVQEGRIAVGEMAMNQWVTNEEHVVRWIKRAIGDSQFLGRFGNTEPDDFGQNEHLLVLCRQQIE